MIPFIFLSSDQTPSPSAFPQNSQPCLNDIEALDLSYRQTLYQVFSDDDTISIRVGHHNSSLDRLVRRHNQSRWALITAHNPYSQPLTDLENQSRNKSLVKDLWPLHLPILRAVGEDQSDQWPAEESFFIIGIRQRDAVSLGQKYNQNAILVGTVGYAPQLRWIG
ncbi:MAG: DUF3293 domain-containing protein [Cyanobacteria bacterium P01_F01_bin.150]